VGIRLRSEEQSEKHRWPRYDFSWLLLFLIKLIKLLKFKKVRVLTTFQLSLMICLSSWWAAIQKTTTLEEGQKKNKWVEEKTIKNTTTMNHIIFTSISTCFPLLLEDQSMNLVFLRIPFIFSKTKHCLRIPFRTAIFKLL